MTQEEQSRRLVADLGRVLGLFDDDACAAVDDSDSRPSLSERVDFARRKQALREAQDVSIEGVHLGDMADALTRATPDTLSPADGRYCIASR